MRQKDVSASETYILRCFFMGVPRFFLDDQMLDTVLSRKAQALLAYLAVTARPHARDSLTTLLWPQMTDSRARKNLRTLLYALRKVFADELEITTSTVALIKGTYWSDVNTFRSAVASQQPPTERMQTLQQALTLYQGKFLQNFHVRNVEPFEEWMHHEREQLQLQLIDGLTELVNYAVATRQYRMGIAVAQRLITADPWLESGHIKLIQLLAYNGQRTEALAQYEHYYQNIQHKFGMKPNAEITAFVEQLRHQQTSTSNLARVTTLILDRAMQPPVTGLHHSGLRPTQREIPNNLTKPTSVSIGRDREVTFICNALLDSDCRLLTVAGPGGIGKTHLALQAGLQLLQAEQTPFPHGIYFISLSSVLAVGKQAEAFSPPAPEKHRIDIRMAATIAEQMGLSLHPGIPVQVQLLSYLRRHQLLLILDDFEQLLSADSALDAGNALVLLLTTAPSIKALVAARNRLNVRGETVIPLKGLPLSPSVATLQDAEHSSSQFEMPAEWQASAAVTLLTQRAQQIAPHFTITTANWTAVASICQLIGGIPLGIELAAGMLSKVSPHLLAEALSYVLNGQANSRAGEDSTSHHNQTTGDRFPAFGAQRKDDKELVLQIILDFCWERISTAEQQLLTKLMIFPTTFDHTAASVLVGATKNQLVQLSNYAFLIVLPNGRYTMHRSIRELVEKKFQAQTTEFHLLRSTFADYYLNLLQTTSEGTAHQQREIAAAIYVELDNIRLAWHYAIDAQMYGTLNKSCSELFFFYELQAYYTEALDTFSESYRRLSTATAAAVAVPLGSHSGNSPDSAASTIMSERQLLPLLLGRIQAFVGFFHYRLEEYTEATVALEAALIKLRKANDAQYTLTGLIMYAAAARTHNLQKARALQLEALALISSQKLTVDQSWPRLLHGEIEQLRGNFTQAEADYRAGCILAEQINDELALHHGRRLLGHLYSCMGRYEAAEAELEACIADDVSQTPKLIYAEILVSLGDLYRLQGETQKAAQYYLASHQLAEELQFQPALARVTWSQAMLAEQLGDYAESRSLFMESIALHPVGAVQSYRLPTLGWAYIGLGQLSTAYQYFKDSFKQAQEQTVIPIQLDAQVGLIIAQWLHTQAYDQRVGTLPTAQKQQLQEIYENPAATQETRNRIVWLRETLLRERAMRPMLGITQKEQSERPA